ncbi:MAG: MBL fold metallo-hydrolase [Verrucomicrobia bacterium]|nr:MBL fold metallo-hydrolase [Verrucomicrobiota bacterium]MBI3869216.1 MBL fold metallo-hydrolase [Verrucomicrobiota bacterium]
MVKIPLEDNFVDVINKAQRGLELSDEDLSRGVGVSAQDLSRLKAGQVLEEAIRKVARGLGLGENSLVEMARQAWRPEPRSLVGLAQFNTRFGDMTVNSYLVWDPQSLEAAAFDTGANAFSLMAAVRNQKLRVKYLLLTHAHGDHVADVDRIVSDAKAEVWISEKEPFPGARLFGEGQAFSVGRLKIAARSTTGHSVGGTTYVVEGLASAVAVVGDALFASSMGGGKVSYTDALAGNRSQILSLPEDCVLCPGHGPITTVGEEKRHNPFFPEFQK